MFRKLTIEQYNEILSSKAPTPGGGSALAMVGAMACSLCQMAVEVTLTKGKNEYLANSLSTFKRCIDKLQDLAQDDSTAFEKILAVSRQVRSGEVDKSALQKEYHKSALVPIEVMQVCKRALDLAENTKPYLYKYVASDCYIGVDLLKVVIKNSLHNVYANTGLIVDETLKHSLEKQAEDVAGSL